MTFSNNRIGIGKKIRSNTSFELVRYVTSTTVVGGASKLLSAFIKAFSPTQIYSYSDNRYSVGKLYTTLGFSMESENRASYWYYHPATRKSYHRYTFTKHKLVEAGFSKDQTERQIMYDQGYLRIWNCGTRTWVIDIKD